MCFFSGNVLVNLLLRLESTVPWDVIHLFHQLRGSVSDTNHHSHTRTITVTPESSRSHPNHHPNCHPNYHPIMSHMSTLLSPNTALFGLSQKKPLWREHDALVRNFTFSTLRVVVGVPSNCLLVDPRGAPRTGSKFFHFHAVLVKKNSK